MVEKAHMTGWLPSLTEPLRTLGQRIADWFAPASEAAASTAAYRIAIELPGVDPDNVELSISDDILTVSGEKLSTREERGETWFFSEREYGAFSRSFRLPPDADADGIAADMKDGVLTITIPKKGATESGRKRIEIRRG